MRQRRRHVGVGQEGLEIRGRLHDRGDVLLLAGEENAVHDQRQAMLVVEVVHIRVAADLVPIDPGDPLHELGGAGIGLEPLVGQPQDGPLDPLPARFAVVEFSDEVVGHVPGVEVPDLLDARLQLAHPGVELVELPVFALLLQGTGAEPEGIHQEPLEAAEHVRQEDDLGILRVRSDRRLAAEPQLAVVAGGQHVRGAQQTDEDQEQQDNLAYGHSSSRLHTPRPPAAFRPAGRCARGLLRSRRWSPPTRAV